MFKKSLLLMATGWLLGGIAMGQSVYEESQARLIEPKQDVFIVPLVADIEILDKQVRQEYGPYAFDIQSLSTTSIEDVNSLKARALYKAAHEANADLIVAATFNVKSDDKGKKMIVNVSGYPGKYINFRPIKLEKAEDYKWIETVYPTSSLTKREDTVEKTKATK